MNTLRSEYLSRRHGGKWKT